MKFIRYASVQVVAYGLDMFAFVVAITFIGLNPILANIFGKIVAGSLAFFLHRNFTFQTAEHGGRRQAIGYFSLLGFNVPLTAAALALALFFISSPTLAKLVSDIVCVFITYWISKRFVFVASKGTHSRRYF